LKRLVVLLLLAGCAADPPPPPHEDLATLARINELDVKVHERDKERESLLLRIAALEATAGRKAPPDPDQQAKIMALEARVTALEDKITLMELQREVEKREEKSSVLDRRPGDNVAELKVVPKPGEVVKPLVAISGESFSFLLGKSVEVARLAGVEAPSKETDEKAASAARERLEELLTGSEVRFEYPDKPTKTLQVYAKVKRTDGSEVVANEVLLVEGLVRARGEHPRKEAYEKLEAEARAAKRGQFR
jgi:endonuclease YncB( thermonuclease family)